MVFFFSSAIASADVIMALFNRFAWFVLTHFVVLVAVSASRNSAKDEALNEPEDLLLEELMRGWKWAREHQSQDPLNRIQHQQLQAVQNRPFHSPLDLFHHKFGYRPHEAGFHQSTIPRHQFNPIHENAEGVILRQDGARLGQKEKLQDDEQPEPRVEYAYIPPKMVERKEAESVAEYPRPMPGDAVRLTEERFREPVSHAVVAPAPKHDPFADIYLTAVVAGCTASVAAAMLAFGVCFYRWQNRVKSAQDVEYPAYGITGPGPSANSKGSLKISPSSGWIKPPSKSAASGDRKLAHSAHMFHFQHQKQQVIAMESHSGCDRRGSNSGGESDEDNEEGDYTVYECPGLAPTGEMEVKNPLFLDDPTPATPAANRQSE